MTIDKAIKDLEYGSKQLEMEIKSGLWIKGSESELRCKESITLNKQYIEWLKELKDLRKENKVLIQKCDRLIKEKGADVQSVVRCKDCKHRKERHYEESGEKPYIKYECKFTKYSMSDEGFCSFGAKKDGEENE